MAMKQRSGRKKNKGFSLLEVVVAITIIAILAIPIIKAFVTSATVNKKARRVQNATDVAQSVSEYLCNASFDDLANLTAGGTPAGITTSSDSIVINGLDDWRTADKNGIFCGAANEQFIVDVEMKSRPADDPALAGVSVKNYTLQELKDLFGNNSVSCMQEITKYDDQARSEWGCAVRATTFNIDVKKNGDGTFDYEYELIVNYGIGHEITSVIDSGTISGDTTFPALYVAYDVFDQTGFTDTVSINYKNDCNETDNCPMMKMYFIQQKPASGSEQKLSDTNFTVNWSTLTGPAPFTCINNLTEDGLITSDGSKVVKVYDITVDVKLNGSSVTSVSTVREEIDK